MMRLCPALKGGEHTLLLVHGLVSAGPGKCQSLLPCHTALPSARGLKDGKERREPKGDSCTYLPGGSWGSTLLEKQAPHFQRHFPKSVHFPGNIKTHLRNPGKAGLFLLLAAQALQLELIFIAQSLFPRVPCDAQPRAPYKQELPAASGHA